MKVLNYLFQQRDWVFVNYHDKMSQKARDHVIIMFRDDLITKIMIIFLKYDNVKLNLIMILHIICIDLWWNSSMKQQVFCCIFHIDQFFKIFIIHLVIKNSVDEKLQMLQNSKREIIDIIIDDIKMLNQLSLMKLMQLFELMNVKENKKSFILMNKSKKNENVNERMSAMKNYELRVREMLIVISWI